MRLRISPIAPADSSKRELVGTFARVRFFFEDAEGEGGTLVGELVSGEVVRGRVDSRDEFEPGLDYLFFGRWDQHARHGHQFCFDVAVSHTPHSHKGILKYLQEVADGVGRTTAERLWAAYNSEAVTVLTRDPERVIADGIMRPDLAQLAAESLRAVEGLQNTTIDLMDLFRGRGFPHKLIKECVRLWGVRAPCLIRKNPFLLMSAALTGCGFLRCDRLYLELGHPPARLKRQALCIQNAASTRSQQEGHTWHNVDAVVQALREKIGGAEVQPVRAIKLALRARLLSSRRDENGALWLSERSKARAEATVARKILELMAGRALWPLQLPAGLSEHQRQGLEKILSCSIALLLGTPGVGKTFTAGAVIRAVAEMYGIGALAVAAPTGKAATRLTAALRRHGVDITATTIHKLLAVTPGGPDGWRFGFNARNPLPYRVLVIDESSMLDTSLAASLLEACSPGTNILFVGDPYQLAPVGHGAPLRDLIDACVPHTELTEIMRNSGQIIRACAAIKAGKPFETCDTVNLSTGDNLRLVETNTPEQAEARLLGLLDRIRSRGEWDVIDDVQVLVARNVVRQKLNKILQAHLNPDGKGAGRHPFREGDKIICLKNSRLPVACPVKGAAKEEYVANGDVGRVEQAHERFLVVRLRDPERLVKVPLGKINDPDPDDDGAEDDRPRTGCNFDLAYACTTHKFQGSECPVIIILPDPQAGMVAAREWHYCALSRAQDLCVIIGRQGVIEQQCRRVSLRDRKTFLTELLTEVAP